LPALYTDVTFNQPSTPSIFKLNHELGLGPTVELSRRVSGRL